MDHANQMGQSPVTAAGQVQVPATLPAEVPAKKNMPSEQSQKQGSHADAMHHLCKNHMHHYVQLHTQDNQVYSGIITYVDDQYVHLSPPMPAPGMMGMQQHPYNCMPMDCAMPRAYHGGYGGYGGYHGGPYGRPRPPYYGGGYGYGGYGYGGYPGYGYGYGGYSPIILPLATLVALSLLPW